MFDKMIFLFNGKAKELHGIHDSKTADLKNQRYWYVSALDSQIASLITAFKLAQPQVITPTVTSSFLFEFYERLPSLSQPIFNRHNYYVKTYLND